MHLTQTIIGGVAVIGALQLAVLEPVKRSLLPPPPPIVVHSIEVQANTVIQDRTVNGDAKFTAVWSAEIKDARTGRTVPNCAGSGSWTYATGRSQPEIPLTEWVGNADCVLPAGSYQALASYEAGTFRTTARSDIFEVME
jgi:hypothetical protein